MYIYLCCVFAVLLLIHPISVRMSSDPLMRDVNNVLPIAQLLLLPLSPKNACMANSPSDILLDTSPRSPTAPYPWPPQPEDRRSRAPEFYGFVAWTSTYLLYVLYILWALLPDAWIQWVGVTWYPNRFVPSAPLGLDGQKLLMLKFLSRFLIFFSEWALLIPSWTIIVIVLTYITYSAIAIRATPAFNELSSITGTWVQAS